MSIHEPRLQLVADYPPGALRAGHRRGETTRLRRGAYVPAGESQELQHRVQDRCVAVARRLRVTFAFSHETAVILHGLPTFLPRSEVVHVLQEVRPSSPSAADIVRHVVRDLLGSDVTQVKGLPVTTLDRTCVDCVRTQSPDQSLAVADAILRRLAQTTRFAWPGPAATEQQIRDRWSARIGDLGRAGGVVRARAVIAHADGRAESPAESQLRWRVLVSGFVEPDLQVPISTHLGIFYPDLLWSGAAVSSAWRAVALEYDGVAKYGQDQDLYREKQREDALRAAGCLVIRATKDDLRNPRRMLRELEAHVRLDPDASTTRQGLRASP